MKAIHALGQAAMLIASVVIAGASYGAESSTKAGAKARTSRDIERGRYLVMITGCNDCHTPNFLVNGGKTPEQDRLIGGKLGWRGPWGTTYPSNLRLYFSDLTEEQWLRTAREIQRRPPMPYFSLNAMTDADLKSIYRYIRALGPVGEPAPAFVPPDREPPQPYVLMPGMVK